MRRIAICLYLVAGAWLVAGCGHRPPQQPQAYVTATLPSLPYVTATLPPAAAPVAVVTVVVPSGQFRNHTAPDLSQYTPMPLPEVDVRPAPQQQLQPHERPRWIPPQAPAPPPPGITVPNVPGNGVIPGHVGYPTNLLGTVFLDSNGALHMGDMQSGVDYRLRDPGRLLNGWMDEGYLDIGGVPVYGEPNTITICRAVPYGAANPDDGSAVEPRYYREGDCEMG